MPAARLLVQQSISLLVGFDMGDTGSTPFGRIQQQVEALQDFACHKLVCSGAWQRGD